MNSSMHVFVMIFHVLNLNCKATPYQTLNFFTHAYIKTFLHAIRNNDSGPLTSSFYLSCHSHSYHTEIDNDKSLKYSGVKLLG